jgi:hypothetical protein
MIDSSDNPVTGSPEARDASGLTLAELGVLVIASLANLVPIWWFRYFAGQDTPNHLYAAEVLRTLVDGSAPAELARVFRVNVGLKSNMAFHGLSLGLGHLGLSLDLAHRLILSAYALAFPVAALFCARRATPSSRPLALLFLPLTWNWFALQGLYNYILSLVPALVWLGLVARDGGRPRARAAWAIGVAAFAVYLCHVGTFVALMLVTVMRVGLRERGGAPTLRRRLASARPLALALAPTVAIACVVALGSEAAPSEPTLSVWEGYSPLMAAGAFFVEFAIRYHVSDVLALGPPLMVLVALPLWAASRRLQTTDENLTRPPSWPLAAAAALTILYFVLPHIVSGSDVSPRLRPLVVFCLFCYAGVTLSPRARQVVSILALVSGLASVGLLCRSFAEINRQLDDFTSAIPLVKRGARLYPMVFDPRSPSILVKPFLHAWGYYGVERDVVTPYAFAWHPSRFPYRYRDLPAHGEASALPSDSEDEPYALLEGRACEATRRLAPSRSCDDVKTETEDRLARLGATYDYVLTWRSPSDFSSLLVRRGYSVLRAQGAMILFRTPPPPLLPPAIRPR